MARRGAAALAANPLLAVSFDTPDLANQFHYALPMLTIM
jgi:hypothetical protein